MIRNLLCLSAAAIACGGTPISQTILDAGPSLDVAAPIDGGALSLEAVGPTLVQAACESLLRCPATSDNATSRVLFGTVPSCVAAVQRLGNNDIEDLQRGVREGRIRYDGVAAARCLDGVRARCDVGLALDDLCGDVFQGTIASGGQCFRHEECAGDGYCRGSDTCPGVCTPRLAPGATCETDRQCQGSGGEPGACLNQGGSSRCVQLQSAPAATEGQPCGIVVGTGSSMGTRVACGSTLYCRREAGSRAGTCQRPLTAGSPCRSGDACEGSNVCTGSACRSFTLQTTADAPCDQAMFTVCSPLANLQCASGRCASVGTGELGSACATGDFAEIFSCNGGLYCERTNRRCAARLAAGMPCTTDRACVSNECRGGRCLDRQCNLAR